MSPRWASLALALFPATAGAQRLTYEGGLSLATGAYIFTARTTSWALTTGLSAEGGRWTVRVAAPLLVQNSSLITGSGVGWMPSGGPSSGMVRDTGGGNGMEGRRRLSMPASAVTDYRLVVGDPTAQLAWRILEGATGMTASVAAKAPLTDTTAFGTGAWDVGAGLGVTHPLGATGFLGLDLAYWHLGDLPELDFRDPMFGTLSAGRSLGVGWAGSAFVSGATPALRGFDAPVSIGVTVMRLGPSAWAVSGTFGLTDTAPDVVATVNWRLQLRR